MPAPYNQYIPPKRVPGEVFHGWRIIRFDHRKVYFRKDGVARSTLRFYECECTNCGHRMLRSNLYVGGCRNCYLMPKGQAGCNRAMGNYLRNSNKMKRDFTLTSAQFRELTSCNCYYCGAPPSLLMTCNENHPGKQSTWGNYICNGIDRRDNSLGYTPSNCVSCCLICNRAKNSLSFQEFTSHIRSLWNRFKSGNAPCSVLVGLDSFNPP